MPGRPHLISHGQLRDEPAVYSTAGNRVSSGGTCSCSHESQQTCIGRPVSRANRPPTSHVISIAEGGSDVSGAERDRVPAAGM